MNYAARSVSPGSHDLRRRIEALGPWFHNMELGGVWTAPDHFLGDYPNVKFKRFAPHLLVSWLRYRHISPLLWFSGFMVVVLGGITVWLQLLGQRVVGAPRLLGALVGDLHGEAAMERVARLELGRAGARGKD